MERLNRAQIGTLKGSHKSNPKNRSKFFDCVSLVKITPDYAKNREKQFFLSEMTKHITDCEMRFMNG